jgi:hypothetical protein
MSRDKADTNEIKVCGISSLTAFKLGCEDIFELVDCSEQGGHFGLEVQVEAFFR